MAFAPLVGRVNGVSSGSVSSQAITNPSGSQSGDLIIVLFGCDSDGGSSTSFSIGGGTGWAEVGETEWGAARSACYWKRLNGSGDTLTVNLSIAYPCSWQALRIRTGSDTTAPEFAVVTGNSDVANPPSLNPAGWGTEDTLWIAGAACHDARYGVTTYPSSYTQGAQNKNGDYQRLTIATCLRNLNAASEDPGAFTWDISGRNGLWWTIAVRYAHLALSGTIASDFRSETTGGARKPLAGSGASRLDTTFTGTIPKLLTGSAASRLDTTTDGNILGWTGRSRFDATFVGEITTSTTWALSGTNASRIDTTFDGTNLAPLTGSAASRFDTTFVGTNVAWLTGSAASRIDTNLDGTHLLPLAGSAAGRVDATFDGVITSTLQLVGSAASRFDTTFTGVFDYKITGSLAGRLDTTFVGSAIRPLAGSATSRIDTTTAGLILKYLTGSIASRVDTTIDGTIIKFLTGALAGRLDTTFTGSLNYIISGTLASRLDTTFAGYKYWPITGSIGSRFDTTFDGQTISSILISGLVAGAGTSTLLGDLILGDIYISGLIADAVPSALVAFVTTDEVIAPSPATATPLTPLYGGVRINWQPMLYKKEHDE